VASIQTDWLDGTKAWAKSTGQFLSAEVNSCDYQQ